MAKSTYAIHPAIGIARVGNAPEAFYLGPESANGLPLRLDGAPFTPEDFRDADGRLCRQAARFRIHRSVEGGPDEEVTLDTPGVVSITWRVHVANKKASWYQFQTTQGEHGYAPNHPLRNPSRTTPAERRALLIDPGPRTIAGRDQHGVRFSRDTIPAGYEGGVFPPEDIEPYRIDTLGELRTDAQGRLLFLGGHGHAGTDVKPPQVTDYANNDGWRDDVSDGPVHAVIIVRHEDGTTTEITTTPAWVLCGPPSYAPQIPNVVTLYDVMFDTAVRGLGARPDIYRDGAWQHGPHGYEPYFETDIKPIFERVSLNAWVTAIPPGPHRIDLERLGRPDESLIGLRQYYLASLRAPGQENVLVDPQSGRTLMPYLAGDDSDDDTDPWTSSPLTITTSKYVRLTDTQYFFLMQWAAGHFRPGSEPMRSSGEALTRATLDNCVGAAFDPGIEMTWLARNPAIYAAPFRIRPRSPVPEPLSLGLDLAAGLEPGDVTRYMALPWHADFNECSAGPIQGRVLWWWPAQRPEFVYLPPEGAIGRPPSNQTLRDGPGEDLGPQVAWVGTTFDQRADDYVMFADDLEMVEKWHELGFVYDVGSEGAPRFVEVSRRLPRNG